jgi:hypothetical protein
MKVAQSLNFLPPAIYAWLPAGQIHAAQKSLHIEHSGCRIKEAATEYLDMKPKGYDW